MAKCIGCKCTDERACEGGCWWIRLDRDSGKGVCSKCPDKAAGFDKKHGAARRKKK